MRLPENYSIVRRNVKHARLRVHEDGSVQLFVPNTFTDNDVYKILEMKAQWIASKHNFFHQKEKIQLRRNEILLFGKRYIYYYSSQYWNKIIVNHDCRIVQARKDLLDVIIQERWLKTEAKKYIRERASMLSKELILPYNRLFVRSQNSKWGNCSKEKNISINWRIIKAPTFVIDYVIIHELCHTVVMKHTIKFRTLLQSHCPEYKQAQFWLEKYGNSL